MVDRFSPAIDGDENSDYVPFAVMIDAADGDYVEYTEFAWLMTEHEKLRCKIRDLYLEM